MCPTFFVLCLHFLSILKGSSSSTVVHEQRPFERKAEEDDGKVSWRDGDSASLLGLLFVSFASVSSQTALWFERGGFETGVGGRGYTRTIGMPVCHCGNRQSDRHIEGLGCCRAFRNPPSLTPHSESTPTPTRGNSATPQNPPVFWESCEFPLSSRIKYLLVQAKEWSHVHIGWLVPWYPKVCDHPSLWLNSMSADTQHNSNIIKGNVITYTKFNWVYIKT